MAFNASSFSKKLRLNYPDGIFALNFGGRTHTIVASPSLSTALLNQKAGVVDFDEVGNGILINVFGIPSRQKEIWAPVLGEVATCYKYLLTEPSLGSMVGQTAGRLKENVMHFVSFTDSAIDQTLWERSAMAALKSDSHDEKVVEASLLPLVRDFVANTTVPTIMGSSFLANFPDFFDDLWTLDQGFMLLGAGLPRWVPIPAVTRAHIARKKLLDRIATFHQAMEDDAQGKDPGPDWRDLDDVSTLVKERTKVYRKHNWSIRARAALELSLLWATNANSNVLIFWIILRICSNPEILSRVREEISPPVHAVQPKQEFPVPELPRFENFDVDGLCNRCPLLKSCYVESLRVDTASRSMRTVKQDFVLHARGEKDAEGWLLRRGDFAHAAHDMYNTDPGAWYEPLKWLADRHIRLHKEGGEASVDLGSMRPYGESHSNHVSSVSSVSSRCRIDADGAPGGGVSMCKGRAFAFKECMVFAAAILTLWDIEPAGGEPWKIPRYRTATGVFGAKDDVRVWIRRRQLEIAE